MSRSCDYCGKSAKIADKGVYCRHCKRIICSSCNKFEEQYHDKDFPAGSCEFGKKCLEECKFCGGKIGITKKCKTCGKKRDENSPDWGDWLVDKD
ncbi:MAG: hypothetical protein FWB98_00775 [Defluviitaleaceae bacterium]|nr:hypothetical protein [Defluviitaleaceae bacterium]